MRLVEHRGKWAVSIDGKRLSTGIDFKPENRHLAERASREILAARARALTGETVSEILAAYIADMPLRANPKQAGPGVLYARDSLVRFFGAHHPDQITRDECRAYIAHRKAQGRADGTIRKEISVLAAALRWNDPATPAVFDLPAVPPARSRWLTRDEARKLIDASAQTPHAQLFIHLALATGGRREAILGLQWDTHINFETRQVWLGFKPGGKGRATVPMTQTLFAALQDAHNNAISPYVIEWAGEQIKDIKRALRAAYARAGIKKIDAPAHVLRHTAGAWMAQDGVPMLEISRRLGHSSVQVTERHYAHLHPDYMHASTSALELRKVTACSMEQKTGNGTGTNGKRRAGNTKENREK